jgi:hypothetical protein
MVECKRRTFSQAVIANPAISRFDQSEEQACERQQ